MAASGGNQAPPPSQSPTPISRLQELAKSRELIFPMGDKRNNFKLTQGMDAVLEEARTRALTKEASIRGAAGPDNSLAVNNAFNKLQDNMHSIVNKGINLEVALQAELDKLKTDLKPLVGNTDESVNNILTNKMATAGQWVSNELLDKHEKTVETEVVRQLSESIKDRYTYGKSEEYKREHAWWRKFRRPTKQAVWEADSEQPLQKERDTDTPPMAAEVDLNGAEAKAAAEAAEDNELQAILRTNARKLQKNIALNKPTYFTSPDVSIYAIKRDEKGRYSFSPAGGGLFPHTREWWHKLKINPFTADNVFLPLIDCIVQTQKLLKNPISETHPIKAVLTKPVRTHNDMPYEYTAKDVKMLRRFMETAYINGYPVVIQPDTYSELDKLREKDNSSSHAMAYIFRGLAMVALKTAALAVSGIIGLAGVGLAAACGVIAMGATVLAGVLDAFHILGRGAAKLIDKAWVATGHESFMGSVMPNDFFIKKMWKLCGELVKGARDLHLPTLWGKNILKTLWDNAGTAARRMTSTLGEDIDRLLKDERFDNSRLAPVTPPPPDAPGIREGEGAPVIPAAAPIANMGGNPNPAAQPLGDLNRGPDNGPDNQGNIIIDARLAQIGEISGGPAGKEAYNTLAEFICGNLGSLQRDKADKVLVAYNEKYPDAQFHDVEHLKNWLAELSTEERQTVMAPVVESLLKEESAEHKACNETKPTVAFADAGFLLGFNVEFYKGEKMGAQGYVAIDRVAEADPYHAAELEHKVEGDGAPARPVLKAVYTDPSSSHCDLLIADGDHRDIVNTPAAGVSPIVNASHDEGGLKTAVSDSVRDFKSAQGLALR